MNIASLKSPEDGAIEDFIEYLIEAACRSKRWERRRSYAIFLSTIKSKSREVTNSDTRVYFLPARDRVLQGHDTQRWIAKFL